jgi:SAM-dependent methyltransferase
VRQAPLACAALVFVVSGCGRGDRPRPSAAHGAPVPAAAAPAAAKAAIPYAEATPLFTELASALPADLAGASPAERESRWTSWLSQHDAEIRRRLDRGDEDSVVNFWLYGTSFTSRARATERDLARLAGRDQVEDLLIGRLGDLVAGMINPGANERLRFARQVVERRGITLTTPAGQDQAREYLVEARARTITEHERYRKLFASANLLTDDAAKLSAYAAAYRDRGLSSDTSIAADFALDQALSAIAAKGVLARSSVRRIAIIGPGLDFTDKAEGYDFYPLQTIQPFALMDSLVRLGLARAEDLRLTTFDLSPRVNQHLTGARDRAARGEAYVLQLPLDADSPARQWAPDLVTFWKAAGGAIGDQVDPIAPPAGAGTVRVRAVRVRPPIVAAIEPVDLNAVVERLVLPAAERFDLVVATNVLVYYDAFEQALALSNIAAMLKPGGFFLTNYAVTARPPFVASPRVVTKVFWDRQQNGDTMFVYERAR